MMTAFISSALAFFLSCCPLFSDYDPVRFEVSGEAIIMNGVIDIRTKSKLRKVLARNPQVTYIIMEHVDGSVDDEANLKAARLVRSRGLNTFVPSYGVIASGGTDFFLSGVRRIAHPSALIGVHSWAGEGVSNAATLPVSHPEHQKYLDYYRDMGIPEQFYWFTLNAASSEDIHWMTPDEISTYQLVTDSLP